LVLGRVDQRERAHGDPAADILAADKHYEAQIYRDGPGADYRTNPQPLTIEHLTVTRQDSLTIVWRRAGSCHQIQVPRLTGWAQESVEQLECAQWVPESFMQYRRIVLIALIMAIVLVLSALYISKPAPLVTRVDSQAEPSAARAPDLGSTPEDCDSIMDIARDLRRRRTAGLTEEQAFAELSARGKGLLGFVVEDVFEPIPIHWKPIRFTQSGKSADSLVVSEYLRSAGSRNLTEALRRGADGANEREGNFARYRIRLSESRRGDKSGKRDD